MNDASPNNVPEAEPSSQGSELMDAIRHPLFVRVTHWIYAVSFFALVLSGIAILLAYPRLHWGETGTVGTPSFIDLPLPFVLDLGIRGPGRYLHFLAAWVSLFTGLTYAISGLLTQHFRKELVPRKSDLHLQSILRVSMDHLRFKRPSEKDAQSYNLFQRLAYLTVVFVLYPFMFITGFAMSPSITSVFPIFVNIFGGFQTARTLHFFAANLLVLFLFGHVAMVILAGFVKRCRAMITGFPTPRRKLT
jgi:thiosulfate reductase cytochrome b subunit